MPLPLAALAALVALATGGARAQWVVETNSLRIVEPADAAGRHDAAIGDFGVPLYGATLSGEVQYVGGDSEGCTPFSERVKPTTPGFPVVLLVDRGDCYFIEKAYNAEKAGAQAVIVADFKQEKLLTMAAPEDRPEIAKLKDDITIPTALVTRDVGDTLKKAVKGGQRVVVELDWADSVAHPDSRVEWELWSSTDDGCGPACDRQTAFLKSMSDRAATLEAGGYTAFTPRYIMHRCGGSAKGDTCRKACIHAGRYCAFAGVGGDGHRASYDGRALMTEAKRRLCAAEVARKADKAGAWWKYAAEVATSCTMEKGKFNDPQCAKAALTGAGLDAAKVEACVGDVDEDRAPDVLEENYDAQGVDAFGSSKILIVPTVVINGAQYRGRLDVGAVTRGLCAGFSEVTEPAACLTAEMEVDECATGTHGCWTGGKDGEFSACVDTFRGYKCQCPFGFRGDGKKCEDIDECEEKTALCDQICHNTEGGYTCACRDGFRLYGSASGPGACFPVDQCSAGNGGCEEGCTSSDGKASCQCRAGLRLGPDGKRCEDVDECRDGSAGCEGGCDNRDPRTDGVPFVCTCPKGQAVDPLAPKRCVGAAALAARLGVDTAGVARALSPAAFVGVAAAAAAVAVVAGAAVHSWRVKRETAAEVAAILRQYMPLDGDDGGAGLAGLASAAAAAPARAGGESAA